MTEAWRNGALALVLMCHARVHVVVAEPYLLCCTTGCQPEGRSAFQQVYFCCKVTVLLVLKTWPHDSTASALHAVWLEPGACNMGCVQCVAVMLDFLCWRRLGQLPSIQAFNFACTPSLVNALHIVRRAQLVGGWLVSRLASSRVGPHTLWLCEHC